MQIFIYFIIFVFGIVFGSFYNVLGYRLPKKESIVFPSSHCPSCNHKLKFLDLIPILSYVILKGRCRYCKKKISIIYPLIELITGLLFILSYRLYGLSFQFFISIIFSSVAVITIASDIRYMVINDEVLIVGGVLILILIFASGGVNAFLEVIKNALISFIMIFIIKLSADYLFKK